MRSQQYITRAKNGIESKSVTSEKTNHPFSKVSKPAGPEAWGRSPGTFHRATGSVRFANGDDWLVFRTAMTVAGIHLKRSSPKNQKAPGRAPINVPSPPSIQILYLLYNAFFSTSSPILNSVPSPPCDAISWNPTGRCFPSRSTVPLGTEMAGTPARLTGTVNMSAAYIATGSALSPNFHGAIGLIGNATASIDSNTRRKSERISSRTARAFL